MRLDGRIALVTGASSGIGRAIAIAFAEAGADVAINYRDNERGAHEVASEIEKLGRRAMPVRADVTHPREVEDMVELVTGAWQRLDVLVNNAGVVRRGSLFEIDAAMWDDVVDVNLKGAFLCAQSAARWMLPSGRGAIVNIASMRGVEGGSTSMHYAAAKGGLITLTKSLARELAPAIRVNAVAPGYVETRIQADLTPEKRREIIASTPLKRIGLPEEIARVALFFASDASSYVTGQTLLADGGRVMT
ncbi:MAG TPA: 3-oxoacyl-ACP reductase family protein [Oscillatoriaceae cyanobacterium]